MLRIFILVLVGISCTGKSSEIDIQGHRGARGLLPENSIPGFIKAIDLGVNTLEMDLSVTGDSILIVSHEPYFSPEYCSDSTGSRVSADTLINIYTLTYEDVQQYDCGSLKHPRFQQQANVNVRKPKLTDVLDTVESYLLEKRLEPIHFNIELKTRLGADDIYHPRPEVFSEMVYSVLSNTEILNRTTIQSFDFRTLKYFNKTYPDVQLALLIENDLPWKKNLDSLGFVPEIYSCDYQLLSREIINDLQKKGMRVIPWTVNDTKDMQQLIDWGVDGIITDYPDRAVSLINQ